MQPCQTLTYHTANLAHIFPSAGCKTAFGQLQQIHICFTAERWGEEGGGWEAMCFFCSKNIRAPSGSLLSPPREMVGTRHLAGSAEASGLPDENGFSHF